MVRSCVYSEGPGAVIQEGLSTESPLMLGFKQKAWGAHRSAITLARGRRNHRVLTFCTALCTHFIFPSHTRQLRPRAVAWLAEAYPAKCGARSRLQATTQHCKEGGSPGEGDAHDFFPNVPPPTARGPGRAGTAVGVSQMAWRGSGAAPRKRHVGEKGLEGSGGV